MEFMCQVCFETQTPRFELPSLCTGNGDVLRLADCQHPVCQDCMATYVRIRVEEQCVFQVCCPFVGCRNELFEQDLQRLVTEGVLDLAVTERFAALRAQDFSARVTEFEHMPIRTDNDVDFLLGLHGMRLCPRCKLVIQRSEGCNSFYCICGEHFDYALADRPVGHGFTKFHWVVQLAKNGRVSLAEAATYGGDIRLFRKVELTASQLCVSRNEAHDLHMRAQKGDEAAQARICQGRVSLHRECRVAKDGVAYTLEQFKSYYHSELALKLWQEAAKMIIRSLPRSTSPCAGEELRTAADRVARSKAEFLECFGQEQGTYLWCISAYEVSFFGAFLPLVQLVSNDVSIHWSQTLKSTMPASQHMLQREASHMQQARWPSRAATRRYLPSRKYGPSKHHGRRKI